MGLSFGGVFGPSGHGAKTSEQQFLDRGHAVARLEAIGVELPICDVFEETDDVSIAVGSQIIEYPGAGKVA